ncbi:MAG: hypothetical protein Q8M31_17880 [Beijerinckiaceae bacterium]|nr:hypothetical protein [Beijerinckiaceae bacterium]
MQCRLTGILGSVWFFLAIGSVGAAADNQRAQAGLQALILGSRVSCSLHRTPQEPLDPATTSALPDNKKFVAGPHFKENISSAAEVRISWLGATFMRLFAAKVEDNTDDVTLQIYALSRPSSSTGIVAELGDRHETKLSHLWCLLKRQANGEDGALQTNAGPNVFFVRDATGVLGAVDAIWAGAGWEIGASQVEVQRQWPSGSRVISR